jgi:prepilin-type N-terminal cleavage/methylation domain-containing protein
VRARRGFTLLEMIAVVAILGMMLFLFVPGIGATDAARLRSGARELGAHFEYARQRAVLTGRPHRVRLELDEGWYQLEWFATDLDELPDGERPPPLDLRGPIPMSPPEETIPSYRPVPSAQGEVAWLDERLRFGGVQVDEGWYEQGEFQVVFQDDGSSDAVRIVVETGDDPGLVLEIMPLLDAVRIVHDEE